jgi:hypothetical protein
MIWAGEDAARLTALSNSPHIIKNALRVCGGIQDQPVLARSSLMVIRFASREMTELHRTADYCTHELMLSFADLGANRPIIGPLRPVRPCVAW